MNIKNDNLNNLGIETEGHRRETYRDNSKGGLALVHQLLHNVVFLPSGLPPILYDLTHHEIKLYPSDYALYVLDGWKPREKDACCATAFINRLDQS